MNVLILSAACCNPSMAAFDGQAKKVIEQAIEETGVRAEVKIVTATTALYGGAVPKHVMNDLMNRLNRVGLGGAPAILIDGEVISYGVPQLEEMKAAIRKFERTSIHGQE